MSLCTYVKVNGHHYIFFGLIFFFRSRLWTSIYDVGLAHPKHHFPEVVVKGTSYSDHFSKGKNLLMDLS